MNKIILCKLCGENTPEKFRTRIVNNILYYLRQCKSCEKKLDAEYKSKNKDKISSRRKLKYANEVPKTKTEKLNKKEYDKQNYISNKNKKLNQVKNYRYKNRDNLNLKRKQNRNNNPSIKLKHNISIAINNAIKRAGFRKQGSILNFLKYSINDLKINLESKFEDWMTWDNHGIYNSENWNDNDKSTWTWNLDHIIPQSRFKYNDMISEEFINCWALSNLRPYSAKLNIKEGARRQMA